MTATSFPPHLRSLRTRCFLRSWTNCRDAILHLFDVVLASLALVVVAPIMAVIAVLILLTSPGPAIFRQVRVGHRQQNFRMLKFRTMCDDCGESLHREFVTRMLAGDDPRSRPDSGLYKLEADPRVTRSARSCDGRAWTSFRS